jgi:hypothetical protein
MEKQYFYQERNLKVSKTQSTVVSIVPVHIKIQKTSLFGCPTEIAKASPFDPKVLIVDDCWHRIYLGVERSWMNITDLSADVARAIVNDFIKSSICTDEGAEPGIFSIPNKVVDDIKILEKEYKDELALARVRQDKWEINLIKMADDDWSKSGHMHRAISNLQRDIAKRRRMEKEWLFIPEGELAHGMVKCPACKIPIEKDTIICASCKLVLKPEEYKKFQFAVA